MPETLIEQTPSIAPTKPVKKKAGRPPKTVQAEQPKPQVPLQPANPDKINWVTPEEAERYEKMLFKPYARKTELVKGEKEKFFYQITSMCPFIPAGVMAQTHQHLVTFMVQKFHRKEFITRHEFVENRKAPKDVESNAEVKWIETDKKDGSSRVLDADACFQIESRKFEQEFVRDDQ